MDLREPELEVGFRGVPNRSIEELVEHCGHVDTAVEAPLELCQHARHIGPADRMAGSAAEARISYQALASSIRSRKSVPPAR